MTHAGPTSGKLAYQIGKLYLKLAGWRTEGELPNNPKGVLIAAPHTSNWDLPYMLAVAWVFRLKVNWLGKHTLFEGPAGGFMRWLGGLPVDRRARHGAVAQVAQQFHERDAVYLAIAPAGTRSRSPHWKSGFYHIAAAAQVPIVCAFLDFGRKVGGVGPAILPSGNIHADMAKIRTFYQDIQALKPDQTTPIRLKDEDHHARTTDSTPTD